MMENNKPSSPLLTSNREGENTSLEKDLVRIRYHRVQKISPEYLSVYEGIDQNVDVELSTFIFSAAPEPVLYLYDFIMTTFVPDTQSSPQLPASPSPVANEEAPTSVDAPDLGKIRVRVNLSSVQCECPFVGSSSCFELSPSVLLMNGPIKLATLGLSAANAAIHLRNGTLHIEGQLGNLMLTDDTQSTAKSTALVPILSIEGDDLAKFTYETYNPVDTKDGVYSSFQLRAGSLKFHFLEQPLADLFQFLIKFARLKGLYDAATQAAVQRAAEIQRMKFDILVQSPILLFPVGCSDSRDRLMVKLGQIAARNDFVGQVGTTTAALTGIRLTSTSYSEGEICELKVIEDVNITSDVIQTSGINRTQNHTQPETEVSRS